MEAGVRHGGLRQAPGEAVPIQLREVERMFSCRKQLQRAGLPVPPFGPWVQVQ